jgi:predicted MFS family arabinose efflux permease
MSAPPPAELSDRARPEVPVRRVLGVTMLAIFATSLFVRAVDPVIPPIAAEFAVDPATVALLSTAFALPYALVQPALGLLADRFGKTTLITLSLVALTIAALAGALVTSFPALLGTRIIAGIFAGGIFPIALALAGDLVPVQRRQVAIGRILGAAVLGNLLGSPGSGFVADVIGWRGVFFLMAGVAVIALATAVVGYRGIPVVSAERPAGTSLLATYGSIFRNPLAKICFGSVLFEGMALFGIFPYIAIMLQQAGETRASIAGIVISGFGFGGIVYTVSVSLLLARLGERRLMLGGGVMMGLAVMAIALRPPWQAEFVMFFMLGLAFYMLHGVIQIYATELAPSARGSAMAFHSSFYFFGIALGPVVYGIGIAHIGLTATVLVGGLTLITIGTICARHLRRPHAQ